MIAYLALFGWPVVVAILFGRLSPVAAAATAIIGGYLLLPTEPVINLPLVPALGKHTLPGLAALVMLLVMSRTAQPALPGWLPRAGIGPVAMVLFVGGAFATVLTNTGGLNFGPRSMPGLGVYDAFSGVLTTLVMLVPFLIGRRMFAHPDTHATLLKVMVVLGLGYSLLALYEVRMSPQLNRIVYGFFPHDWVQHIRDGGFRPLVFLEHGLFLGIFLGCAALAALGLVRSVPPADRFRWLAAAAWLIGVVFLAKVLGAFLIVLVLAPALMWLPARSQLVLAAVIALPVLLFPMLRSAGLIPTDRLVAIAASIDDRRAGSLQYRFDNEDILLDRAREKPLFGWGGWGRQRVINDKGEDISTTDGYWIITFGTGGLVRYLAEFGLMTLPILLMAWRRREFEPGPATAALALAVAANLIDAIPNSGLTSVSWLMAGALFGRYELGRLVETPAADLARTDSRTDAGTRAAASAGAGRGPRRPGFAAGQGPAPATGRAQPPAPAAVIPDRPDRPRYSRQTQVRVRRPDPAPRSR